MNVAKSSLSVLLSNVGIALIGFIGTILVARLAGASVLGTYVLFYAVIRIGFLFTDAGLRTATSKRISEGQEGREYLTASFFLRASLFLIISLALYIFRPEVMSYIGASFEVYVLLFPVLFFFMIQSLITSALSGEKKVGRSNFLSFIQSASRVAAWALLLYAGFQLYGLVAGLLLGYIAAVILGIYFLSTRPALPSKRHFTDLLGFSKYSWMDSFKGKARNWTDSIVLGFFVSSDLIGIYEVGWSLSGFFFFAAMALGNAMFPNISNLSEEGNYEAIESMVSSSLRYMSIIAIPGLLGSVVLGSEILKLYGDEFSRGYIVLIILVAGRLFQGFEFGFTSVINGLNRPDLSFYANSVFLVLNVTGNIVLIYTFGWIGAAVATTGSMLVAMLLSLFFVRQLIDLDLPLVSMGHELMSAVVMLVVVFLLRKILVPISIWETIALVLVGAAVYFGILFRLNRDMRDEVESLLRSVAHGR